jgi:hypothetical protein
MPGAFLVRSKPVALPSFPLWDLVPPSARHRFVRSVKG